MWFKSYLYYTLSKKLMADLPLVKAGFIDFEYIPGKFISKIIIST